MRRNDRLIFSSSVRGFFISLHAFILTTIPLLFNTACARNQQSDSSQTNKTTEVASSPILNPSADSLMAFVEMQTNLGPRIPGTESWRKAGEAIAAKASHLGAEKITHHTPVVTMPDGKQLKINNIFVQTDTANRNRVMLLAHYDTRPWADNDPDPTNHSTPVMGANDGASGVAVMLEILRLNHQQKFNAGLDLLFVDAEDSGHDGDDKSWCIGSRQWVSDNLAPGRKSPTALPRYAILLDMVGGRGAHFAREQISDYYAREINDMIFSEASRQGLTNIFKNRPGGAITDDHIEIIRAGIPCADLIDNANPLSDGGFNPTWHTISDTPENIDPQVLKNVTSVIANVINK